MLTVLRQRDFSLLWFAGLISITGDWMLMVALPIAVYDLTGSATALSGVVVARLIPTVALASLAGVFVDRWDRKRTMVVVNVVRAPVLLPLLLVDSADRIGIVYVVAFVGANASQFFRPAENALLPRLVDPEHLVPANSLNALNNNLAGFVGPALGGVTAAWVGLDGIVAIDAATFLLAAALIAAITASGRPEPAVGADPSEAGAVAGRWRSVAQEWLAGIRLVRRSQTLLVLFLVGAVLAIGEVGFTALLVVFVADSLDGGSQQYGWLLTGQAIGGLLGSALLGARGAGIAPGRLLGGSLVAIGLLDLALFNYPAVLGGVWLGIALRVLIGLPVAAANASATTLLQSETTDAYRGRVFGALGTTMAVVSLVAAPVAGLLTERLGVVVVLSALALVDIAAGAIALRFIGLPAPARSHPTPGHNPATQPARPASQP